jgi:[NiFe] hydrogenase assembly HybE family chaperone
MFSQPARSLTETQTLLTDTFSGILRTRMNGIPVVNEHLYVSARHFCKWHNDYVGVLITPWFMNLILIPATNKRAREFSEYRVGSKHHLSFPSGSYEFTLGAEDRIGTYLACSLFSPMFDFADQNTAEDTAEAVFAGLMDSGNREILTPEPLPQSELPQSELSQAEPSHQPENSQNSVPCECGTQPLKDKHTEEQAEATANPDTHKKVQSGQESADEYHSNSNAPKTLSRRQLFMGWRT